MKEDIANKLKKMVVDHLGVDEAKVTEELRNKVIENLGSS